MKTFRMLTFNTHNGVATLTSEVFNSMAEAQNAVDLFNKKNQKKPMTAVVIDNNPSLPKSMTKF